ncbi:MAG: indole-3-glycerol phosphate synthase TrpC [Chloroflexi bacterium]|nr:indole-3-glycerol phosphate synthase TrpC [Chloroflexota bacterium]MCI0580618.1 indole-3-glycerol phosphate synthase TrpC [Chloroflexota bacterium]MCI0649718.1 indole-3-glycerol phosphate synthase TrpC [Chloroflexota bacterium]MCI0727766.1 indole-3-glycerol phosphate synthase TrpC [Chloroflexota bacterium]
MSVSNVAKRRGTILDEIMRFHREQLPKVMREVPLSDLRALASLALPAVDFCAALRPPGVSLIAECKKASPSKGLLVRNYDPVALARSYVRAGARAISVLTDARHFQGSLEHLRDVKEALKQPAALIGNRNDPRRELGIPVLRKDFIFHPYQVYQARAAGADAVLLIAAVLEGGEIAELLALAHQLQMNALVEVHTEQELEQVLPLKPRVVGVNNRNLQTFEVDFETTARLRRLIPAGVLVVAESGIKTPEDVRRLRELGVNAILVGETLVKSKDVYETARTLVQAGR